MTLMVLGVSHKTASVALREQFALSVSKQQELLQAVLQLDEVSEGLLLCTCNRLEIYVCVSNTESAKQGLTQLLKAIPKQEVDSKIIYCLTHENALMHGFEVACGLDSMVLGENQIFSQMKESYSMAESLGSLGSYLNRYFQRCFSVSKKVRSDTSLGAHPVSVSYVAILLAKKIFGSLESKNALLIGAGKMGELALQNLKSQGCQDLTICNRNVEKAQALAEQVGGQALPLSELDQGLKRADVVICSSGAQEALLTTPILEQAMQVRQNKPLFIIDIAMPRNVEASAGDLYNVYLYNLDDLQKVVDQNLKERQKEAVLASQILKQELQIFLEEQKHRGASPTIAKLRQKFEQIQEQELQKLLASSNVDFSEDQMRKIRACTQAMMNKILHHPLWVLKSEEQNVEGLNSSQEFIKKLFRLDAEEDHLGN